MAQLAQDACFTVDVILLVIILQLAAVDDLDGHLQGAAHKHYLLPEADTTTGCSLATFLPKQVFLPSFPCRHLGANGGAPLALKYDWDVQKGGTDVWKGGKYFHVKWAYILQSIKKVFQVIFRFVLFASFLPTENEENERC